MNNIPVKNIFAAVFEKSILDPLLAVLDKKSIKFWGTEGTIKYLKSKGFDATSVVAGFDFDARVKSLDRAIFARILADRTNKKHLEELRKLTRDTSEVGSDSSEVSWEPFDLVVVDLYKPDKNNFPESMDIGGQVLIRAAIKNYKNVALAFNQKSIGDLVSEIRKNNGLTTLAFRRRQARKAALFIAQRCKLESVSFNNL